MNWLNLRKLAVGAVVGVSALVSGSVADAGWYSSGGSYGSWGSSGGSYGSYGSWGSSGGSSGGWASSGGSSGGWASSGGSSGGWRMRHHHRRMRHASSGGSHGSWGGYSHASWGSSGGSSGGWASSGGSSGGSYGGSYGGYQVYDSAPGTVVPPTEMTPPYTTTPSPSDATTPPPPPAPGPGTSTSRGVDNTSAALTVSVPAEAKILVNGRETKATGTTRRYVSRGLQPGYNYTYEIKAELERDGQTLTESKSITVAAGEMANVDFVFEPAQKDPVAQVPVKTTLILRVPADAKVFLAGRETASTGELREFATTKLAEGATWAQYPVRVEVQRDGRTVAHEQTVSLAAGESREVVIDLGSTQLASTSAAAR
jgi:uncharacterized protein (TIGR03000 family)